jgi:hypothetical protein
VAGGQGEGEEREREGTIVMYVNYEAVRRGKKTSKQTKSGKWKHTHKGSNIFLWMHALVCVFVFVFVCVSYIK